jgi:metallo-beta-lactamase family protein
VNHGEDSVTDEFAAYLENEHGYKAFAPYSGTVFDLAEERFTDCPAGVPVPVKSREAGGGQDLFRKLTKAGEDLTALIRRCKGRPNKELQSFINALEELCRRFK